MAEVLAEMPPVRAGGRRANGSYDKYLDGQIWKLTAGVDFKAKNYNTAQNGFRLVASRKGKSLSLVKLSDDPLVIAIQARERKRS